MGEAPLTRVTLLARLRDPGNAEAWREFVHLYGPVIYRFARQRGLQDADAADLMQDVLRSVARHVGELEYDRRKGTFRGWLYTITRNKIYNFLLAQRRRPRASGDDNHQERLDTAPARETSDSPDAQWEREYQRQLSWQAMERVRHEFQPNTWQAFWLTAVEGQAAAAVGEQLKMSPGAVYVAKCRVLARLREEVQRLLAEEDD
jgi:RNA polymerase sigma-70 factor (ECF subfamily)